jgi:hypothetical protein
MGFDSASFREEHYVHCTTIRFLTAFPAVSIVIEGCPNGQVGHRISIYISQ